MPCTAQQDIQGIAEGTFEPVTVQLAIVLDMANRRFNGATTAPNHSFEPACYTASLPQAQDLYLVNLDTPVAEIEEHHFRLDVQEDGRTFQLTQRDASWSEAPTGRHHDSMQLAQTRLPGVFIPNSGKPNRNEHSAAAIRG